METFPLQFTFITGKERYCLPFCFLGSMGTTPPHSSYSVDSPSRKSSVRKLDGNHHSKQLRKQINRQKCPP